MRNKKVLKKVFYILSMLITPTILSCGQDLNRPMGYWGHMMGFGSGGGYMWFLIFVLLSVVAFFLFQASKSKSFDGSITETPLDILKRRYAEGDIDKEEFDRRKDDLQA